MKAAGCSLAREGKGHSIWYSPITGRRFPVPRHKTQEVPLGTLRVILKSAGLE